MAKDSETRDGPKIRVTRRGGFFVKGAELLRSKAGRKAIQEAADAVPVLKKKSRSTEEPSSQ